MSLAEIQKLEEEREREARLRREIEEQEMRARQEVEAEQMRRQVRQFPIVLFYIFVTCVQKTSDT